MLYLIHNFFKIVLVIGVLHSIAWAQEVDFQVARIINKDKTQLSYRITTDEAHYFNTKAPTKINLILPDKKEQKIKFSITEPQAQFQIKSSLLEQSCDIEIEMYICDKAKTYCVPKSKTLACEKLQKMKEVKSSQVLENDPATEVSAGSKGSTDKKTSGLEKLFIHNKIDEAFALAKKENKPLLIDVYGVWCPPCNVLDETVFNQPEFKKEAEGFVLLKVDADLKSAWEIKSKYGIKYLPTVVYATPDQEEISRFVGAENLPVVLNIMKDVKKNKNLSLIKKIEKVNATQDPSLALEIAEYYDLQENKLEALRFYTIASKSKKLSDEYKDKWNWLTISVGIENSKEDKKDTYFDLVLTSYQLNPLAQTAQEKLDYLKTIASQKSEAQDESFAQKLSESVINVTTELLRKNEFNKQKTSKADVYFMRAEAYEVLKNIEEQKKNFALMAQALQDLINEKKLDLKSSRGYSLDRLYALYKSGQYKEAYDLYEKFQNAFPDDFTFFYGHARALKLEKKLDEAIIKARLAYEKSYGDNRLRVAQFLAETLKEIKKNKEATALIDEVLQKTEAPHDENLSTFKLIAKLKKLKEPTN